VLARIEASRPGQGGLRRAIARSYLVSADMAHAVHPNRPDLHDGVHLPRLNGGPVVKVNANQRYATDAETGALFRDLCRRAEVPCQDFVMRQDLPCGSTIGPISAAGLGIRTVDVGNPMLSMHSIRELAGARDPALMTKVLIAFLAGDGG
jgi:aspartyl aminopeptidase